MNLNHYCSISVDVDSLESLNRFHGAHNGSPIEHDPVYQKAIPRFLKFFDENNVKATFFIIGKDCENPLNHGILREISSRGHEIANHSFNHVFGFSMLSVEDKIDDLKRSTASIKDVCGSEPVGFRAPGYDIDETTIDMLDEMGYVYDSSIYSFFLYPVMRSISYQISKQKLNIESLRNLPREFLHSFAPLEAYHPMARKIWRRGECRNIVEIPISVMPYLRLPFNSTFLFLLGPKIFDFGFWLTKQRGMNLSYTFHASDLLCSRRDRVNLKHPGLNVDLEEKQRLFYEILRKISEHYDYVTLKRMAELMPKTTGAAYKKDYTQ